MSKKELDKNLRYFYAEARTRGGALYSRSSLLGLRNAIERYLNNPPFNRGISITKGTEFQSSNKLLQSMIKLNKRENNENTKHKPPIPAADLQKLKSSDTIRGDEATKNHSGGIEDISSVEKEARMYSTSDDPLFDGLNCLKNYIQKLNPNCEAFFQYPKRAVKPEDDVWCENKPLGVNKLDGMMKEISKLASLSRIYTNHSVRATAITLWSDAQVPSRHIMAISGHRSEASLKSYNTRPSSEQLRACSDILSGAMSGGPRQPNSPNAVTSSGNPLATVNSTVVHSQNNTAQQFVKYQPQALSSLFSNCQVNNIQVFMGHDSAGFH